MTLGPIETRYDGYRFRSRLEARWAVFFKTLNIPYEYEKEGYDLGGIWYLPDFWLPQQKCWLEVKGQRPTQEELKKIEKLHEVAIYPTSLFYGLPGENYGYGYYTCSHESSGGLNNTQKAQWSICPACQSIDIVLRCDEDCSVYLYNYNESLSSCSFLGSHDGSVNTDCLSKVFRSIMACQQEIHAVLSQYHKKVLHPPFKTHAQENNAGLLNNTLASLSQAFITLPDSIDHPNLLMAYQKAKLAHFEYGEHP